MDRMENIHEGNEDKLRNLFAEKPEFLDEMADGVAVSDSAWLSRFILKFLTNLDFTGEEAVVHYRRLLEHRIRLTESLGRDPGLRVATLDYFSNVEKFLKNPRILEIEFFEEVLRTSREDPKTGCYNSRTLSELAPREFKRAERYGQKVSFVLIDVDNFKNFNETYGHLFGDRILKVFSDILRLSVREEDIVARYGGDEFAVVMPQTGRVGARSLAERMKQRLQEHFLDFTHQGERVAVTFSAGIATYPVDGQDLESIIKAADCCLFDSKRAGKNRISDRLETQAEFADEADDDRRKFTRYRFLRTAAAKLTRPDAGKSWDGTVMDISPGGILISCSARPASELSLVPLHVRLDRIGDREFPDISLEGKVVRVVFNRSGADSCLVGVEFSELLDSRKWNVFEHYGELEPV